MGDRIYSEVLAGAPFLKTAVVKFLALLPPRAQEMESALAAGDLEGVATVAHRLKGAGGTHGYPAVSECARALEQAARAGDRDATSALLEEFRSLIDRLAPEPPPA